MSLHCKDVPVVVTLAIIILIVGGILHIVGLASPYWVEVALTTSMHKNEPYGHHGLWFHCTSVNELDDTFDCKGIENTQGYIEAVRVLEILAILFGAICIIASGIWFLLHIDKYRTLMMISALGTGFIAGLLGIVGVIIYAAEVNSKYHQTTSGVLLVYTLSWSFALCTVSSSLVIIATILVSIGSRMKR